MCDVNMSNQCLPEENKKMTMEGAVENGVNEESSCLPADKRTTAGRLQEVKTRIVGDTKLSPGVRIAIIVLAILCALLLLVVIVLAVCWPTKNYDGTICSTPDCLRLSASYLEKMETGVDPCENPKMWACGKWINENGDKVPTRSRWSLDDEIRLQELTHLRDALTTMSPANSPDSLEWKLVNLYESCMAIDNVEADKATPLLRIINDLGGWHVSRNWKALSWSWRQALVRLHSYYGITPLFAITVSRNQENATYVHIKPAGLGLPDPTYYKAGPDNKAVRAYKALLKDTAMSLDALASDAAIFADDVFAFEERLAKIQISEESDGSRQVVMTWKEFTEQAQFLQLQDILTTIFPKISLTDNLELMVSSPKYITHLSSITTGTDSGILNDYFIWALIREYLPYMSRELRLIWRQFQSHVTGSTDDVDRWEFCTGLVQKTAPLGVTALLEHDSVIDQETLTAVKEIFESVRAVAQAKIVQSEAIAGRTKSMMLAQVNSLTLQIGLRHEEKQSAFLIDYHKSLYVQKHNLFQNIGFAFDFQRELLKRSYFDKDIQIIKSRSDALLEPTATFNDLTNQIVVPKSLLKAPSFSREYPRAVKYARLGLLMATAVAQSMAYTEPDTDDVIPQYAESSVRCLQDLLNNDGNQTAGINLASNAFISLVAADMAREAALATHSDMLVLPQLENYGQNNIFAVAYAQSQCFLETEEQVMLDNLRAKLDGDSIFRTIWPQIEGLRSDLGCRHLHRQCTRPL